jgi:choline-sulfatase
VSGAQRTCNQLVEHVDLVPTMLDYAGGPSGGRAIAQPGELPGRSLRPILEGRASDVAPKEHILCEHGVVEADGSIRRLQCLRTARYKYVFNGSGRPGTSPDAGHSVELYDLEADPQERVNVAADPAYAAQVARSAELLIASRLATETNAWKCGLAATTPQPLDPFGLPTELTP